MTEKRKNAQVARVTEPIAVEEAVSANNLNEILEEIKNLNGVVGYILRNSTSALVNLDDPTRMVDYALLSSSSADAAEELAELFDLGNVKSIVVEGKDVKMLSLTVNENEISIFTDKGTDSEAVLKKLRVS